MAFADLGMMGTVGNTSNNQASLILTATTAGAAIGNLVVIAVAVDNRTTGGGDDLAVASVTDSVGNVYIKGRQAADAVATQAGSSVSIWWSLITTAIPITTGTITANFTTNTLCDAQCMAARKFSITSGNFVGVHGTNAATSTTTNPGSLDVATDNAPHLRIRAIGCEYDSTQALTPTAGGLWAAWTEIASAGSGTTTEQCLEVEWIISTGTGDASAPTLGANCDNASVYVAFQEITPAPQTFDPPPRKKTLAAARTLATLAALSAVAEPVYIPPVATSSPPGTSSSPTVITSKVVYDQTSAPVFVPRPVAAVIATPDIAKKRRLSLPDGYAEPVFVPTVISALTSTLAGAYSSPVIINSRVVYDPTSTPVFKSTVVATPVDLYQNTEAVWRKQRKILPEGVTPPIYTIAQTPSAFAYQPADATWKRQRKIIPDGLAGVVAVPTVPTPVSLYQNTEAVWRKQVKTLPDGYITPVFQPVSVSALTSTLAGAYSSPVIVRSKVVYDQTATPVFKPTTAVATPSVLGYQTQDTWPRQRVKPVPKSAFVFAIPLGDLADDYTGQFIRRERKRLPDGYAIPPFQPVAVPGLSSSLAGAYSSSVIVRSRVVYDTTSTPVFKPFVATVTPANSYQNIEAVWRKIKKILPDGYATPVYTPVTADTSVGGVGVHSSPVIIRSRVVYDTTATPVFKPFTATVTPADSYQNTEAVWRKQKKVLPDGYVTPESPPTAVPTPVNLYQNTEAVWRKLKKILPEGLVDTVFKPVPTPTVLDQFIEAGWRKQPKVLPEGVTPPIFQEAPPVLTPSYLFETPQLPWTAKPNRVAITTNLDGWVGPVEPVPDVIPPTPVTPSPGGGYYKRIDFDRECERARKALEEAREKREELSAKAPRKALAKAIHASEGIIERCPTDESLHRLTQLLHAAATARSSLAIVEAADAAYAQAKKVQAEILERDDDDILALIL